MRLERTVSETVEQVLNRKAKARDLREDKAVEVALESYMERLEGEKDRSQYHALLEELASLRG